MPGSEIQAMEISCFVQATEDLSKLRSAVERSLGIVQESQEERLEGHYGNSIVNLKWHLTGDGAYESFRALLKFLGKEGRRELLMDLESCLDSHGALYVRLNKQMLVMGMASQSAGDPVRIRIKPRSFMMKGHPRAFYERLMAEARE